MTDPASATARFDAPTTIDVSEHTADPQGGHPAGSGQASRPGRAATQVSVWDLPRFSRTSLQ